MEFEGLAVGLLLAVANMKIVDYIAGPIRQRFPEVDLWWLLYVSLATGFAIAWFAPVNLFAAVVETAIVGRILTGCLVGGGASLIHDVFKRPDAPQYASPKLPPRL